METTATSRPDLGDRIVIAGTNDVVIGRVVPGRDEGQWISYTPDGKIILLDREVWKWSEGMALVEIREERDRVAFGCNPRICGKGESPGFVSEIQPRPSTNFKADSHEEFLDQVRSNIAASLKVKDDEAAARRAEKDKAEADKAEAVEFGQELAGAAGASIVSSLQSHDWYYSYSDDGSVWKRGDDNFNRIKASLKELDREVAMKIWERVAPKDFHFPV